MDKTEAIARELCKIEGIDPEYRVYTDRIERTEMGGGFVERRVREPAWKTRLTEAQKFITIFHLLSSD